MATIINSEKINAHFPGKFNKRESKLSESVFKSVIGADSEDITLEMGDGVNFVTANSTSAATTISLPEAHKAPNRLVFIRAINTGAFDLLLQESDGTAIDANLAAGQYAYQSNGSSYIRVF